MKSLATPARYSSKHPAHAPLERGHRPKVLGSIPGLARLLPGRYSPGQPVRSRYGTWILPVTFKGRRVTAVVDGTMLG
jgi:hypothetical protein